jgi:adenosylcobinamide-GDP ribazoletransferase
MKSLRLEIGYFLAAVALLTRLPVSHDAEFKQESLERGVKYLPLVGLLIGGFCAVVLLASSAIWSGVLPALLAVAAGIALTGAMHEDGLADFFDAMGGATPQARLAIMKDSRIGTYGVLALVVSLAIKVLALAALPSLVASASLMAAHAGGRFAAVAALSSMPYTGEVSAAKIKPFCASIGRADLAIAAFLGLLPVLLLPPPSALCACLAGAAAALFMALRAQRLLKGYTGDVIGAIEQSYEIAFILAAAGFA